MYATAWPPPRSSVKQPGTTRCTPALAASASSTHLYGDWAGRPPTWDPPLFAVASYEAQKPAPLVVELLGLGANGVVPPSACLSFYLSGA
jgi:hypothetical protein